MKRENFFADLIALVLSVAIGIAGIGCIVTGFSLDVDNWLRIGWICTLAVAIYLPLQRLQFGSLLYTALAALTLSLLLRRTDLLVSIESLLYHISVRYDYGYGWGYIRWSDAVLPFFSMDGALSLLATAVALGVCHCVRRKTWVGFGILAGLVPLVLCCVVTDTPPADTWLWLLLTLLLILTMTQLLRRQSQADANRLVAWILIPAVLCSSLLFQNATQGSFLEQANRLQLSLLDFSKTLSELFPAQGSGGGGSVVGLTQAPTHVDLSQAGPMTLKNNTVMSVQTSQLGVFYLRGRSYDTYTGTGWSATLNTAGEGGWPASGMSSAGTVTVKTNFSADMQYFPYYIQDPAWTQSIIQGALHNPLSMQTYSFDLMIPSPKYQVVFPPLSDAEKSAYCALPQDTLYAARQILDTILDRDMDFSDIIYHISRYVQRSAKYNIKTPGMPEEADDFAIWFLLESDSGYCTHFATAATVLLRAAGIPARYVTGYQATLSRNNTNITADQAHAWVEYLHPKFGWTVMDPTPGVGNTPIEIPTDPTTQPTAPTQTQPSETTLPTLPTQTQPSESTLPTQTTTPTQTAPSTPATQPTESTAPPVTTEPVGGKNPGPMQWNLEWIRWILGALAIWGILFGQDRLRKHLRRKKMATGHPNRQAIARWRYAKRLSKLSGHSAAALLPLAEKATFSQHTLTEEELAEFDAWFASAKQQLKQKNWLLRWLLQLIFAIE